jgi:hypothetical protein
MVLERYFIPLGSYAMLASGLTLAVYLFVTLKKEIHSLRLRLSHEIVRGEALARDFRGRLEEMILRVQESEDRAAGMPIAAAPPASGLNLNKRTQAIRLSRRGESADKIAAALKLPSREVQLLLKAQQLGARSPSALIA